METSGTGPLSPGEVRELLDQLGRDEAAVRYPPLPRWFFPAQAAAVAGLHLAQLLRPGDAPKAVFAVAVASVVMGLKHWLNRDGVAWVTVDPRDVAPFVLAILATSVAGWVIAETTGFRWLWIVTAVIAGGIVLRTGRAYRRVHGDGG